MEKKNAICKYIYFNSGYSFPLYVCYSNVDSALHTKLSMFLFFFALSTYVSTYIYVYI
jgi:hypothetical protein